MAPNRNPNTLNSTTRSHWINKYKYNCANTFENRIKYIISNIYFTHFTTYIYSANISTHARIDTTVVGKTKPWTLIILATTLRIAASIIALGIAGPKPNGTVPYKLGWSWAWRRPAIVNTGTHVGFTRPVSILVHGFTILVTILLGITSTQNFRACTFYCL